jgi:hypothetical protein
VKTIPYSFENEEITWILLRARGGAPAAGLQGAPPRLAPS